MTPATLIGKNVQKLGPSTTGMVIPAIASRGLVFTAWTPSPEETEQIKRGKLVWLIQRGGYIPEMTMIVGDESNVVPVDIKLEGMVGPDKNLQRIDHAVANRYSQHPVYRSIAYVIVFLVGAVLSAITAMSIKSVYLYFQ